MACITRAHKRKQVVLPPANFLAAGACRWVPRRPPAPSFSASWRTWWSPSKASRFLLAGGCGALDFQDDELAAYPPKVERRPNDSRQRTALSRHRKATRPHPSWLEQAFSLVGVHSGVFGHWMIEFFPGFGLTFNDRGSIQSPSDRQAECRSIARRSAIRGHIVPSSSSSLAKTCASNSYGTAHYADIHASGSEAWRSLRWRPVGRRPRRISDALGPRFVPIWTPSPVCLSRNGFTGSESRFRTEAGQR